MNTALATGYLIKDADLAFTPGPAPQRFLVFDVMLRASGDGEDTPWRCEINDPAEIDRCHKRLTAGRGVALQAQLSGRPFERRGVREGYVRCLKVAHVEFIRADSSAREQPEEANAN